MINSKFVLIAVSLTLGACTIKQKVMDVPMVSGTYTHLPDDAKLRESGPVKGHLCARSVKDKGSVGLFDEAIKAVQAESGADFISDASFFREGSCISIEGIGQKIVRDSSSPGSGGGAGSSGSETPTSKSKAKKR